MARSSAHQCPAKGSPALALSRRQRSDLTARQYHVGLLAGRTAQRSSIAGGHWGHRYLLADKFLRRGPVGIRCRSSGERLAAKSSPNGSGRAKPGPTSALATSAWKTSNIIRAAVGSPCATPMPSERCPRFPSAAGSSPAPGGSSPSWRPAPPDRPRVLATPLPQSRAR